MVRGNGGDGLDLRIQQLTQTNGDARLVLGVVPRRGCDVGMPQEPARGVDAVFCGDQSTYLFAHFMERFVGGHTFGAQPFVELVENWFAAVVWTRRIIARRSVTGDDEA